MSCQIDNEHFLDSGDIAFVTYEKGEAEAKIRFKTENAAKPVAEKWTEAVSLKEHKVECSILEVNIIVYISKCRLCITGSFCSLYITNQTCRPTLETLKQTENFNIK